MVSSEHRCSLVTVFGPAGIGKSRLAHELAHRATQAGGLAIRGRSAGYGDAGPYSAFAQHVAQIAGIDGDDPTAAVEKLRARAAALAVADDPGRGRRRRRDPGRVPDRGSGHRSRRAVLLGATVRRGGRAGAADDAGVRGHPLRRPEPARSGRVPRVACAGRAAAAGRDLAARAAHVPPVVGRWPARLEHDLARAARRGGRRRADRQAVRATRARRAEGSRRVARGFERREPVVHRGAHGVARGAVDA